MYICSPLSHAFPSFLHHHLIRSTSNSSPNTPSRTTTCTSSPTRSSRLSSFPPHTLAAVRVVIGRLGHLGFILLLDRRLELAMGRRELGCFGAHCVVVLRGMGEV
jgi:hypothetical protein